MSDDELREDATHLKDDLLHEAEEEIGGAAAMLTADEQPSLLKAMGGPLGAAESALPSVAFVIAYTVGLETTPAAAVAVAIAVVAGMVRIARRQTVQFAFTGIVGVVISALVASKTGEARNFFLPGLLANVAYAAITLGSVAVRWPFVGVLIAGFSGEEGWRDNPVRMRAFRNATLVFGAIFVLRLLVQVPLYFADQTAALGVVKTVMGIPFFGIGIWLSWLMLRGTEPPRPSTPAAAA